MKTKRFIVGMAIVLFSTLPAVTHAQSVSEDQYRAYLLSIIELLQQQIILLQENTATTIADPESSNVQDDFTSFLFEVESDVVAQYEISNPARVQNISNPTHRTYFSRFFELVPDGYDDYFVDLLVFEESDNEFDGFVETVPPYREDTWRFGINEAMFEFGLNAPIVEELFVHEFGHIISYESIPGRAEPGTARCHEFFSDLGCPPASSYLIDFLGEFWDESDMDALVEADEGESIWLNRELEENFVSDYAGTNPAEDFAESFTSFVLEDKASGRSIADQKINYFYDFDMITTLREEIRSNL